MPEWLTVVAMVFAVPIVGILALSGVAALALWVWHRGKMAKLEIEEKERQAEADRELLGLGNQGTQAHIEAILERLDALEAAVGLAPGGAGTRSGGVRIAQERREEGTIGQG